MSSLPLALVATALPLETEAVLEHLRQQNDVEHPQGTRYPAGTLEEEGTQQRWKVAVVQVGMGNARAAAEITRAIDFLEPQVALFVGVAGGIKDVEVGDVAVGSKVYFIESGKVAPEGKDSTATTFRSRPEADRGDYRLLQLASAAIRSGAWKQRVVSDSYASAPLQSAHVEAGPIAAGEKVIASTRAEVYRLIKSSYGDSIAVEMEGHGFGLAAYMGGRTPGLVVRGISDRLDGKAKSDETGSQPVAAGRAAAFAFELLSIHSPPIPATSSDGSHRQSSSAQAQGDKWQQLRNIGASLYPQGPSQRALWEKAGGDPAQLVQRDDGRTAWFEAVKLIGQGGGGRELTADSLLREMQVHFSSNEKLERLAERFS